ncbi:MAG: M23 family peptidase [Spirochaetaceae bacterium]|nr:MAG: M23 family peptidase [Spirochaetaceae bacterium]
MIAGAEDYIEVLCANRYTIKEARVARWVRSSGSNPRGLRGLRFSPSAIRDSLVGILRGVTRGGSQRFTLLIIPHSEKRLVKFQANVFAIIFFAVLFSFILAGFVYVAMHAPDASERVVERQQGLQSSQASLDAIMEELQEVMRISRMFEGTMRETIDGLRPGAASGAAADRSGGGDLTPFLDARRLNSGELREIEDIRHLASTLRSAVEPLEEVQRIFRVQQSLLTDIPNYWPVIGGRGRVTHEFGPNIHPFTGQLYLHKGFDIADAIGVPVVASARGRVDEISVDPGYGIQVWLRHRYGFRTMYAHLHSASVREGQDVEQGQQIGLLGNSGASTGPHLHFEVWLGNEVVDPAAFLKISNEFPRRVRSF